MRPKICQAVKASNPRVIILGQTLGPSEHETRPLKRPQATLPVSGAEDSIFRFDTHLRKFYRQR